MRSFSFAIAVLLAGCAQPPGAATTLPAAPAGAEARGVSFTVAQRITPGKKTELVTFTTLVPRTIPGRQVIRRIDYSVQPDKVFEKHGNTYAVFILDRLDRPVEVNIRVWADIFRSDLETLQARGGPAEPETSEELKPCLRAEKYIECDAGPIQEAAGRIGGKDRLEQARNVLAFVTSTLRYSNYTKQQKGALKCLKEKSGDCTEHADLFVALCRAKGIPARTCDGFIMHPPKPGDTARHKWAEVYVEQLGWVPVDPLLVARGGASFGRLPNRYVYATRLRNDVLLDNYEMSYYRYHGENIKFEDSVILHGPP